MVRCSRCKRLPRRCRRSLRQAPRAPRVAERADMRLGAQRQDDFEINVISLIDVMLTLLMFFVLTTTFVQHSQMKVTLPQAASADQAEQREALTIIIDREGRYFIDNNEVLNPGLDSLREAIQRVAGDDRDRP